ncbi:MAG: hypothetical protein AAFZ87_13460 [Planctomycetota bacterium]
MNAWVFRHLDELQRIYREPARERCTPAREGAGPFAEPPGGAPNNAPGPGSVLREETEDGPDVVLMPRPARRRLRR